MYSQNNKAGARGYFVGPEPFTGITYSLAKLTLLNQSANVSRDLWLQTSGLEHSKALINAYRMIKAYEWHGMLTRSLTAYCGLNKLGINTCSISSSEREYRVHSAIKQMRLLCTLPNAAS